jgi:hypothetical protein
MNEEKENEAWANGGDLPFQTNGRFMNVVIEASKHFHLG